MLSRHPFRALSIALLALFLAGCGSRGLDSIQVTPATQSLAVGQTVQFSAVGTYGNANSLSTQNLTSSVTWTSSVPAVASVSASGVATGMSAGTTTITANATGYNGSVSSSAQLTVTGSGNIISLTIIPNSIDFGSLGESGQFLAIGTFSTPPTVRDLTNSVTWITSEPNQFPVTNNSSAPPGGGTENGGVVSAVAASNGNVGAIITAEATDSTGSIATATATVGCPYIAPDPTANPPVPGSCNQYQQPLLVTLTVYNEGLNTTTWTVTAPSATGTPNVLHCGPGFASTSEGSVCTATYPLHSNVTLTAAGAAFGGWSSNCSTINGALTCNLPDLASDETVGVIFN